MQEKIRPNSREHAAIVSETNQKKNERFVSWMVETGLAIGLGGFLVNHFSEDETSFLQRATSQVFLLTLAGVALFSAVTFKKVQAHNFESTLEVLPHNESCPVDIEPADLITLSPYQDSELEYNITDLVALVPRDIKNSRPRYEPWMYDTFKSLSKKASVSFSSTDFENREGERVSLEKVIIVDEQAFKKRFTPAELKRPSKKVPGFFESLDNYLDNGFKSLSSGIRAIGSGLIEMITEIEDLPNRPEELEGYFKLLRDNRDTLSPEQIQEIKVELNQVAEKIPENSRFQSFVRRVNHFIDTGIYLPDPEAEVTAEVEISDSGIAALAEQRPDHPEPAAAVSPTPTASAASSFFAAPSVSRPETDLTLTHGTSAAAASSI